MRDNANQLQEAVWKRQLPQNSDTVAKWYQPIRIRYPQRSTEVKAGLATLIELQFSTVTPWQQDSWIGGITIHWTGLAIWIHKSCYLTSSETQGQIVGARVSKSKCLTRPVPNGRCRSAFWLGRKTQKFSGTDQKPERPRQFGTGLVRHCPQGLFSPFFTFLRAIFFPFRLSLAPTICPWVSEDGYLSEF